MLGKGEAERLALHLEYNWQPDSKFARAALADMNLPHLDPPANSQWKYIRTEGNRTHWELEGSLRTSMTRDEVVKYLRTYLSSNRNWKEIRDHQDPLATRWSFLDREAKPWKALVRIEDSKKEKDSFLVKLELNRG